MLRKGWRLQKKKIKDHEEWIKKTKKNLKLSKKWLADKDAEMIELGRQKDRMEDKIRIRDDYITMEKEKYPLQFP